MNSRDLDDPATARLLADKIGSAERLRLLTILTYADISAVHPAAMTPWRLEQLWQTYRITHQELLLELETARIQNVPNDLRRTGRIHPRLSRAISAHAHSRGDPVAH